MWNPKSRLKAQKEAKRHVSVQMPLQKQTHKCRQVYILYMPHTKIIKNHGKSIFFCILLSNKLHMVHCLSNAMKKEILWVA